MNTLTIKQYKFLKLLSRYGDIGVSPAVLEEHFKNYSRDNEFYDPQFQGFFYHRKDMYYITTDGKKVLQERMTNNFRFWFPVFISVAALILSIISIRLQYL